jgi:hypothetical protein
MKVEWQSGDTVRRWHEQTRDNMNMIKIAAVVLTTVLLSACASHTMAYRSDYIPDRSAVSSGRISGRVLVYTTRADDARVDTSSAENMGGGMVLTTPIGIMTREIALKVFSQIATDGAVASNDLTDAGRYSVIVRPESLAFKHGVDASNLGFGLATDVQCQMRISILDPSGRTQFERDYDSGVVKGKTQVGIATGMFDKTNKLAHETIYDLMQRAADDVRVIGLMPQRQAAAH